MKKILLLTLALMLCLAPFAACGGEQPDMEVLFLSVGKADAILLETKEETVLIDTGYEENYTTIKNALTKEGVHHIDHMILTHFDKDHIGSAEELLTTCTVGTLYMPDYEGTGGEYADLAVFLSDYNREVNVVTETVTVSLAGFDMQINPTRMTSLEDNDDNNHSLIISVTNDNFSMLLMGDAEKKRVVEHAALDGAHYDVIKLPHHGDYFKELESYLDTSAPTYAIHCCEVDAVDEKLTAACNTRNITQFTTGAGDIRLVCNLTTKTFTIAYE